MELCSYEDRLRLAHVFRTDALMVHVAPEDWFGRQQYSRSGSLCPLFERGLSNFLKTLTFHPLVNCIS